MSFDEQAVCDFIKTNLAEAFNTPEWKTTFGNKKVKFTEDSFGAKTTFPVIYINVSDCKQDERTRDSSLQEKYTKFWFVIEHYNQAVGSSTKKELGIKINKKIVETICATMNPWITSNSQIESPDNTIYRRSVEGYCTINNNTKIFYR